MNNSPGPVAAIFGIVFIAGMASCETKKSVTVDEQQLNTEISKINTLLRDTSFAAAMAGGQEATFYYSQGQAVPEFFAGPDSLIHKSQREEKIATNLAGFYALETGIGALMAEKRGSPVEWLHKIVDHTIDSSSMLLLNRFANATWKASQPFRSLERITKDNFTVARLLSKEEIKKDADQISSAASVLLDSLKPNAGSPSLVQMKKIASLLRNKEFAVTMAAEMDAAYYKGQGKTAQAFLTSADDTAMLAKSARSDKIAINIAGFYALECGLNYLSEVQGKLPSEILQLILTDSLPVKDRELLMRFANATWKAGQPFRSLDRITRPVFMPYDLLPEDEKNKDWVQIKTAAVKLQSSIK